MNKLVLFDIDSTLIKGYGHPEAFAHAFKVIYGIDTEIDWEATQGMTDQQIIKETLTKKGLNEELINSKIKQCMQEMTGTFEKTISKKNVEPMDGAVELLKELNNRDILLGIVTGNLEGIARAKLEKISINHYFKIGGFGSDDINRTNLVKLAIKRAEENFNFNFNNNVFLIGDAPREIKAGKEAGVKTIGVTTGIFSKKQLKNTGADFVVANLKDKNAILKIILS